MQGKTKNKPSVILEIVIYCTSPSHQERKASTNTQAMPNKPNIARGFSNLTKCSGFHALEVNLFTLFKCRFHVAIQYAKDPTFILGLLVMYT